MATSIVSNSTAATFGNSPQKTGEPVDRLNIYSGKALEFDGVSDIITWDPITLDGDFTFATWVKIDSFSGFLPFIANNSNSRHVIGLRHANAGTLHIRFDINSAITVAVDPVLNLGQWHRIVFVRDKANSKLYYYVDGLLIKEMTSSDVTNITSDFIIASTGAWAGGFYYADYNLSDYQVWDDCAWELTDVTYDYLNPEKLITDNKSVTSGITTSNLKLWYPMNDTGIRSPQTVIFDAAGTNNTTKTHATTTFTGDELLNANKRDFTNSGSIINSGSAKHHSYYEIAAQGSSSDLFGKGSPIDDNSDWTAGTGWAADAGNAKLIGTSTTGNIYATTTTTINNADFVTITFTVSNYSAGSVRFIINGNTNGTGRSANGTYTESVIVTNSAGGSKLYFDGVTAFTGEISNITLTRSVDFTLFGAPDNYPGTVFCMNHADGSTVPTFDANNTVYAIDLGIATDYSGGDASSKFGIAPNGDNKIYNMGPELFDAAAADGSDASYWTSGGGGGVTVDSGAIKITNDSNSLIRFRDSGALSADLEVGKVYRLTADLKVSSGASVNWYVSGPNVFLVDGLTDNTFTRHTVFFTATNATTSFLKVTAMSSGEEAFIDNLSLKETDILSIEYVDQADGATMYLDGSKNVLMSESLVSGRQYTLSANYKVNTGSTTMLHYDGSTNTSVTLNSTSFADASITFTTNSATTDFVRFGASAGTSEITTFNSISLKEVGIATGWTDADQQQYIPQTGFMDGCIKSFAGDGVFSDSVPSLSYPFSLSCWIYKGDDAAYGVYLVDKDVGNIFFGIALGSDDKVYLQASNTSVKNTNSNSTYTNQWVHVVAVFESATDRNLYINGSQNTDNENNDSVTYENVDRISIGYIGDSSPILSGAETIVDEIAIFNKSLSAGLDLSLGGSEIGLLYNSGQPHDLVEYSKTIKSSSNLVGYWKNNNLNSEGKWKDQSTNSNNCTINGTPDYIFFQQGATANLCTQGYSNNIVHPSKGSIHFLGQEYAAFPGERIINLDGDFTIEFWFKKTQLHVGSGLIDQMLFGSGTNQIRIPNSVSSGKMLSIYYRDGGVNSSFSIHSDNQKSIYEWNHVAIVKESGTLKAYIDTATTGNGTLSSTGQMQIKLIGTFSVVNGFMYKGFLDDLRVYDKALSAAEVTKNYKNTKSQHKN